MARKDRRNAGGSRLRALLDAGDHRTARAEARAKLGDPAASETEREEAGAVLASLAPDRGIVAAGLVGVAVALGLIAWTLLAG